MAGSRREEALHLAEDLLSDIELSRIAPGDIAKKAFRLARLLDDDAAMVWLRYEIAGYPHGSLGAQASHAASRSNRRSPDKDGQAMYSTATLGQLQAQIEGGLAQLSAASDAPISVSSANPNQFVFAPDGNTAERHQVRNLVSSQRALMDKVVGAIHEYVSDRYQELRFGSAMETAFEVVRTDVDARIARLVPNAPEKLAAAFENAASANPEHWANAAQTCRRLLKAAADALRPPSDPVNGRAMTDAAYINRLVDWIVSRAESETAADVVTSDLEYLGRRLDAADDAGHKGAHANVDRFDASRFITGTYLVLGDILRLADGAEPTVSSTQDVPNVQEGDQPSQAGSSV